MAHRESLPSMPSTTNRHFSQKSDTTDWSIYSAALPVTPSRITFEHPCQDWGRWRPTKSTSAWTRKEHITSFLSKPRGAKTSSAWFRLNRTLPSAPPSSLYWFVVPSQLSLWTKVLSHYSNSSLAKTESPSHRKSTTSLFHPKKSQTPTCNHIAEDWTPRPDAKTSATGQGGRPLLRARAVSQGAGPRRIPLRPLRAAHRAARRRH